MENADYKRLIDEARTDLVTHMAEYVRGQQMPLHLTGEKLKHSEELGRLQEIWRRMYVMRERLRMFAGLYACPACEHLEGEHHASDCHGGRAALPVLRPRGWVAPPPSEPAEILPLAQSQCAVGDCIYTAIPNSRFCTLHQDKDRGPEYAKEYEQKPTPSAPGDRATPALHANRVEAREAIEVMNAIIERKLTVVEASNNKDATTRVFVTNEGHRLEFFNDSNELDYLNMIRMPDGREGCYDSWCPPLSTSVYNPADDIDYQALMRVLQW